jgi:hypothetical protein
MTGGTLYHYYPFNASLDHEELVNNLLWNVQREQGFEAMLRLRCSQGVDVESYIGSFIRRETGALVDSYACSMGMGTIAAARFHASRHVCIPFAHARLVGFPGTQQVQIFLIWCACLPGWRSTNRNICGPAAYDCWNRRAAAWVM